MVSKVSFEVVSEVLTTEVTSSYDTPSSEAHKVTFAPPLELV